MFRYWALGVREVCFFLNRLIIFFYCNRIPFPGCESFSWHLASEPAGGGYGHLIANDHTFVENCG